MVDEIIHNALKSMTATLTPTMSRIMTKEKEAMVYRAGADTEADVGEEGYEKEEEQVLIQSASAALRRIRAHSNLQLNLPSSGDRIVGDGDEDENGEDVVRTGEGRGQTRPLALVRLLTDPAAFSRIVTMVSE